MFSIPSNVILPGTELPNKYGNTEFPDNKLEEIKLEIMNLQNSIQRVNFNISCIMSFIWNYFRT